MESATRTDLSVTLTVTPQLVAELQRESGALELARAYTIVDDDDARAANGELKARIAAIEWLENRKAGFVRPAHEIVANAEALFDEPINQNKLAVKDLKTRLLAYTTEKQRLADEARRQADETARKARQEAEAKAAAERARAEEIAAGARREAEEAEARRKQAEAEGNARAAAAAASDAAKATAKAESVVENAEAKAQETILTAAAAPAVVAAPPVKLAGFSTRDNWTAEVAPGFTEEQALRAIVVACAGGNPMTERTDLLAMLKLDMSAAGKLAKALKGAFNVPGLVAVNRPVAASRK